MFASVTDKSHLEQVKRLFDDGWRVVSTGGTATALENIGVRCTNVESVTGFPECLGGRLKTLHPKIFGGILADQHNPEHINDMLIQNIDLFGVVLVNLYDFKKKPGIENIDIGGPSLLRAAAKNHTSIAVICNTDDYEPVFDEIIERNGAIEIDTLEMLAVKSFEMTADYDNMILDWMCDRRNKRLPLRESLTTSGH